MAVDLGLRLLRSGYRALPEERADHDHADAYAIRLLARRAVVVRGRAGARLFYDGTRIRRQGAVPVALADLLFGRGAVHGLDGDAHRERKAMFLDILTEDRVDVLAGTVGRDLARRVERWRGREVTVHGELVAVYGAAVLAWAGISLRPHKAARTSRRLAAIVDGFGGAGAAYPRAWVARTTCDHWARLLVEDTRAGRLEPAPGTALRVISDSDLPARVAGVELLNVLRPTVAVAWPGTFLARALGEYPQWRPLLRDDPTGERRTAFGHEVRRTCPFVPALAGRATRESELDGVRISPGDRVVLDVPGTDRHPEYWDEPEQFLPERFAGLMPDPFGFVPQGGGDTRTGHRCPGEALTVRILAETARVLADVPFEPVGDTSYDPTRIPTLPRAGLRVRSTA